MYLCLMILYPQDLSMDDHLLHSCFSTVATALGRKIFPSFIFREPSSQKSWVQILATKTVIYRYKGYTLVELKLAFQNYSYSSAMRIMWNINEIWTRKQLKKKILVSTAIVSWYWTKESKMYVIARNIYEIHWMNCFTLHFHGN